MPVIDPTHAHGSSPDADRWLAAVGEAERRWPFNAWMVSCDEGISSAVRRALGGPGDDVWVGLRPDVVTLLWPATGEAREVPPWQDIGALARSMAPRQVVQQTCDRCLRVGLLGGAVVVAAPPRIVALSLCVGCAQSLGDWGVLMGATIRWTALKEH
jgi:hypothetical protein